MQLLVAEDDKRMPNLIKRGLEEQQYIQHIIVFLMPIFKKEEKFVLPKCYFLCLEKSGVVISYKNYLAFHKVSASYFSELKNK